MKNNLKDLDINIVGLTLITSCGCNLNCKYCQIADSVNNIAPQLQQETIKALKDGTYLKNVEQVLNKLGQDPSKIECISFWGQEPTLTLHYFTERMEEWLEYFSRLSILIFSTNGVSHIDRIIDFIKKMEETIDHPINFQLQFSYDGDLSSNEFREIDSNIVLNNIKNFLIELNSIRLEKVNIDINIHGVLSLDLVNRLNTTDKIEEYFLNLDSSMYDIEQSCINKNVKLVPAISLGDQCPVSASTEDGIKWREFFIKARNIDVNKFKCRSHRLTALNLSGVIRDSWDKVCKRITGTLDLNLFLNSIAQNINDPVFNKNLCSNLFCGNNHTELKIMYDGTLCNCQNHIFEIESKNIKEEDTLMYNVKQGLATHKYFVNPLKDNEDDVRRSFRMFKAAKENSFYYTYQQVISLMYFLAQANQIDCSYKYDLNKLLTHAIVITHLHQCSYNNQMMSGSIFNKYSGMIRLFCNGLLDESINYVLGE